MNARTQVEQFTFGNGLTTTQSYDVFGMTASISTTNNIQNLSYQFDPETGNLSRRKDLNDPALPNDDLEGVFGYDDSKLKSRLTSWVVTSGEAFGINYQDNGNIDDKTDVGSYTYDAPGQTGGPHALKKIESPMPSYLENAPPQHVTHTAFDKVDTISHPEGARRLTFTYGPQNMRKITQLFRTDNTENELLLKTKYFIGGKYEIEIDAEGHQRKLHYQTATTGIFAIFMQQNTGENMYYIHKPASPRGEDYPPLDRICNPSTP